MKKPVLLAVLISLIFCFQTHAADQFGTFVKVIEKAAGGFDEVSLQVEKALESTGWSILGVYDSGVPEGCNFRSRVVVFSSPDYAASVMKYGVTAAFGLPIRAGIFEDESGIHIAIVNPSSINRTIIGDGKADELSANAVSRIVAAISDKVNGHVVKKQIGQLRTKGRVGGMGGGDFIHKIDSIYETADVSDESFERLVASVRKGIEGNSIGWKLVYAYDLRDYGAFILGTTGPSMEGRAFTIAGEKRASSSRKCPGLDHGAAFPIEVIVYRDTGKIKVVTLDEMYRMKLYFEDAGMWAFMKNMRMPGRIENNIVGMASSMLEK